LKKDTLIEHKEATIVHEESGRVSLSYNALLTTLEANTIAKLVVLVVIAKSSLTCINCGKIGRIHLRHVITRKKRYYLYQLP
jgi:hypothetical protein